MKKYTLSEKWEVESFVQLPNSSKLIFFYLIDCSDKCGVYVVNKMMIRLHLNINLFDFKLALKDLSDKIVKYLHAHVKPITIIKSFKI